MEQREILESLGDSSNSLLHRAWFALEGQDGEDVWAEIEKEDEALMIHLPGVDMENLEGGNVAAWNRLPPSQRRDLIWGQRLAVSSQDKRTSARRRKRSKV